MMSSFEELEQQALIEYADDIESVRSVVQDSLWKQIPTGVAQGTGNAIADVVSSISDAAIISGAAIGDVIVQPFDRDVDQDAVIRDMQAFRDKMLDYIKTEESDQKVQAFTANAVESVGKFAFFYNQLARTGLGTLEKAVVAGAAEGFTDDFDRDLNLIEQAVRGGLNMLDPQLAKNFDKAMDLETDHVAAKQLMRRINQGVEIATLSMLGEKAVSVAAPAIKGGAQKVEKALPEPFKRAVSDTHYQMMDKIRKTKEFMKIKPKASLDEYVQKTVVGDTKMAIKQGAMRPDQSAAQNVKDVLEVEYDSALRINSVEDYSKTLADYERKLEALSPQIEAEVVNLAKSKGVAADKELLNFARALGIEEKEFLKTRSFKDVLRAQAHNILLDQQVASHVTSISKFNAGLIDEAEYLASTKSFLKTMQARDAVGSQAGRTLRTMQDISDKSKAAVAGARETSQAEYFAKQYDLSLEDPEYIRILADKTQQTFKSAELLGVDPGKITKAFEGAVKELKKQSLKDPSILDKIPEKLQIKDWQLFTDRIGALYQANLLSSTATLAQNTFGSMAQMMMQTTERGVEGFANALRGRREVGDVTFREAAIQMKEVFSSHYDAMVIGMRAAVHAGKKATGQSVPEGGAFKQKMMDLPEMSSDERAAMFKLNKEDMKLTQRLDEASSGSIVKSALAGRPIFEIIQVQDTITKMAGARSYMRSRFDTALYVDDVFGLDNGKNLKQKQKIINSMFREGRTVFEPEELVQAGISKTEAVKISQNLENWVATTSKEASDFAVRSALQTPLTGVSGKVQEVLQDNVPLGRLLVPFFMTPVNILNETLKRLPVFQMGSGSAAGLPVHPQFYKDVMAGGEAQRSAVSKLVTGMTAVQAGMAMADAGMATGIPKDVEGRIEMSQVFRTQPGSVTVDDESFSLSFLGPFGVLLQYGANISQMQREFEIMKHLRDESGVPGELEMTFMSALTYNVGSLMTLVKEQPYAQSVDFFASLFELETEADNATVKKLLRQAATISGNLVPYSSLQRQLSGNLMEYQKRATNNIEVFRQQFAPYLNANAYDYKGDPIKADQTWLFRGQKIANDPIVNVLATGAGFVPPVARYRQSYKRRSDMPSVRIELNGAQMDKYNLILRERINVEDRYKTLINSRSFIDNVKDGSFLAFDRNRKDAQAVANKAHKQALGLLIDEEPDILRDVLRKEADRFQGPKLLPAGALALPTVRGEN